MGILYIPGSFEQISDGFKDKMTELGYVEGKNIVYEDMGVPADATSEESQNAARKLIDDGADLIFAFPTPTTIAAYMVTKNTTIPVVFALSNPETLGMIESVREPGGQMTGVRYPGPEMISKRLEFLLDIAPNIKRVWVGYDRNHPNTAPTLEVLRLTASELGVTLVEVPGTTFEDIESDLAARAALDELGIDAIITMNDGLNQAPESFAILSGFATEHRIPLAGGTLKTVQDGAIVGNSPNLTSIGESSAVLANKIFSGIVVGTIPVVTPEQEIYINYKVSQDLGLEVPDGLLAMANVIIR